MAAGALHNPRLKGCVDGTVGSLSVEWLRYMLHLVVVLEEVEIGGWEL